MAIFVASYDLVYERKRFKIRNASFSDYYCDSPLTDMLLSLLLENLI